MPRRQAKRKSSSHSIHASRKARALRNVSGWKNARTHGGTVRRSCFHSRSREHFHVSRSRRSAARRLAGANSLARVRSTAYGFQSPATTRRPAAAASSATTPHPQNGSTTRSPLRVRSKTSDRAIDVFIRPMYGASWCNVESEAVVDAADQTALNVGTGLDGRRQGRDEMLTAITTLKTVSGTEDPRRDRQSIGESRRMSQVRGFWPDWSRERPLATQPGLISPVGVDISSERPDESQEAQLRYRLRVGHAYPLLAGGHHKTGGIIEFFLDETLTEQLVPSFIGRIPKFREHWKMRFGYRDGPRRVFCLLEEEEVAEPRRRQPLELVVLVCFPQVNRVTQGLLCSIVEVVPERPD